jgi:hypothetical protein
VELAANAALSNSRRATHDVGGIIGAKHLDHTDPATPCTMQCVPICSFSYQEANWGWERNMAQAQ